MKKYVFLFVIFSYTLFSQIKEPNYFEIKRESDKLLKDNDGERNNWLRRWLWSNRMDFNSDGSFKYLEKQNQFDYRIIPDKKKNNLLSATSWTPIGPIQIPPSYEPRSCYSMGRINCVAFHPLDSNIIWIGTPGGGIWKTLDHGKSWIPQGDNFPSMAISHIAVDPKNPDILYAATGDFDISGMTSGNTAGVIKSTDGGETWLLTTLLKDSTFLSSALRKIIINPDNTNQLLVAGRRGIWKTLDGGFTWKKVCDSIITDLELNPKNPNVLFAAMGQLYNQGTAGVLKSYNFGETWESLNTGLPPTGQISRVDLAISPADTNYIYVLAVNSATNAFHSFYNSTDGGTTWSIASSLDSTNNILGAWGGDVTDIYGQGSYDLVLLADPYDKNKVYTGGVNMWMSDSMGRNWKMVSFWIYVFGESIHADHHFASFNPADKKFYWCNDGGIYRTSKIAPGDQKWVVDWIDTYYENIKDGAPNYKFPTVWENLNDGLAITEFYRLSLCRNKANILAGGSQDNSCYYYNVGKWLNYIPNYDGMETMIDNDNPDIFYGVWQNGGLCKTTDGGKTLKTRLTGSLGERGNWITPVGMDPLVSNHILIGYRNLWESKDAGDNWSKLLDFDLIDSASKNRTSLSIVKYSYSNSNYISTYKSATWFLDDSTQTWKRVPGELWITQDGGITWKKSRQGLPVDSLDIISIDYDRKNPLKMWVGIYSYIRNVNLFTTTDGGETWTDVSKELPPGIRINAVIHQMNTVNTIYAGTNKGVYYCDDGTSSWVAFNENLPMTIINDLELQESTGEIFAATYGRGMWKTNLRPDGVKNEFTQNPKIEITPNPVKDKIILQLKGINEVLNGVAEIHIFDVRGYDLFNANLNFTEQIVLNPKLNPGVYFIELETAGQRYFGKFIKQ